MDNSVNMSAADISVPVQPTQAVPEQLKRQYGAEVSRAIEEVVRLLPSYRTVVDSKTYERDRAGVMLVVAYVAEGEMGVRALPRSLNYLLKQEERFTAALQRGV